MSTTTETQTSTAPPSGTQTPPEITVLTRVASIPMIHSSLETLNDTLSSNSYTRSTYCAAKELSSTAYKYTEPLQVKLAPLILRADGYANLAVDAVEARLPYPFKAKPEEVVEYVRERRQSASQYVHKQATEVNKAFEEKVTSPALTVAQDFDQRFAPLVDYFEVAVCRLNHSEAGPSSPDPQYQYQRALALSKTLKDNLYGYSTEQLKHIQAQSAIIQRATETAQSINAVASSSISSAQSRIHGLSDSMLAELQKLQASASAFATSVQASVQNSTSQLQHQVPPQIQHAYTEISSALLSTITDLADIMKKKDLPLQEKVGLVGKEVRERVTPLLETVQKTVSDVLARGKEETSQKNEEPKVNGTNGTNGTNGHISESE